MVDSVVSVFRLISVPELLKSDADDPYTQDLDEENFFEQVFVVDEAAEFSNGYVLYFTTHRLSSLAKQLLFLSIMTNILYVWSPKSKSIHMGLRQLKNMFRLEEKKGHV